LEQNGIEAKLLNSPYNFRMPSDDLISVNHYKNFINPNTDIGRF